MGFTIGKGIKLKEGNSITIVATGHLVWESLQASDILRHEGISAEVINIHTIKPIDEEIILKSVKKTGCILTAEEHNFHGGLGETIAGVLSRKHPVIQRYIATNDTFGESGTPLELMKKYELAQDNIVTKSKELVALKNK